MSASTSTYTYTIRASGCDDATTVYLQLTDSEAAAVAKVARAITAASGCSCEPRLFIASGKHERLESTDGDL